MQTDLKAAMENVMKSIGVVIELRTAFEQMAGDDTYAKCIEVIEEADNVDRRSQSNYALLLFTTAKVRRE